MVPGDEKREKVCALAIRKLLLTFWESFGKRIETQTTLHGVRSE